MRPRRSTLVTCALLAVAAAATATAVFLATSPASFAGAFGGSIYSFPHEPHLSAASINAGLEEAAMMDRTGKRLGGGGKVDQECRVCHDYTKSDESHLSGCMAPCHVDSKHLVQEIAGAPKATGPRFPHKEHLKDTTITCFSCHRVKRELGWVEFTVPAGGLGKVGPGGRPTAGAAPTCADCHHTHEPNGGVVKQDETTGDGKACGVCHLGVSKIEPKSLRGSAPAASGTFRHADHGAATSDCAGCHAEMKTSKTVWDSDPVKGTAKACLECHVDDKGGSIAAVSKRTTELQFVRFSRFPHGAHIAPPTGKIETSSKVAAAGPNGSVTPQCATCHYPEADPNAPAQFKARAPSAEPVSREELIHYAACTPCHADWRVEGHGGGDWTCFRCHVGGEPDSANGKLPMMQANVRRETLAAGVRFKTMAHPGITTDGARLHDNVQPSAAGPRECRDCHKGEVDSIPARVAGKPFTHDAHLTKSPTKAECLACHTSSAESTRSVSQRRFEAHLESPPSAAGASAAARGCLECHAGAKPEDIGIIVAERTVPEFTHKKHVTANPDTKFAGFDCTACHSLGGQTGYTTAAAVLDCTQCHSHDQAKFPEKFKVTGRKTSTEDGAKRCGFCHENIQDPTPPAEDLVRRHLELTPGKKQFHNKGGDCAACHGRDGVPYAYQQRIKRAEIKLSIHEDTTLAAEWFNQPNLQTAGNDRQGRTCMTCHRKEPRGYLRALNR